jgi:uncharacterized protein (TIGR02145 family)
VTDIDGNEYKTITIGTQTWMAENLRVTHYRDGDPLSAGTSKTSWDNLPPGVGAYCNYGFTSNASSTAVYGRLYNWYAVSDSRNIAPEGWHVPTDAEWTTLTTFLGGDQVAGGLMKEAGTTHWIAPNTGATNSSGFTALPAGYTVGTGGGGGEICTQLGYKTVMWSSTAVDEYSAMAVDITKDWAVAILGDTNGKGQGRSVRCVKD